METALRCHPKWDMSILEGALEVEEGLDVVVQCNYIALLKIRGSGFSVSAILIVGELANGSVFVGVVGI